MIPTVFDHLKDWVRETLGEVEVSSLPPSPACGERSVSLYLKDVTASPTTGTVVKMDRLQIQLTYLVTTNGKTLPEADDDLAKLVFSAMLARDMTVDLSPLSSSEWRAFGLVPRPSFLVKTPLTFTVEKQEVKRVEKPLVIRSSSFSGKTDRRPE